MRDLSCVRRRYRIRRVQVDGKWVRLKRRKERRKSQNPPMTLWQRVAMIALLLALGAYFGFFGRWAFYRLGCSIVDLCLSLAEYILIVFGIEPSFLPSFINRIPDIPYIPFLPLDSSELAGFWSRFAEALFDGKRFLAYNLDILIFLLRFQRLAIPLVLLFVIGKISLSGSADVENDDFGKQSRGVRALARVKRFFLPAVGWVISFIYSLPFWSIVIGAILVLAGTNAASIVIEMVAELLHLSVSADYKSLYIQLYKLLLDLTVMLDTLPLPVWLALGYFLSCKIRRYLAFRKLDRLEGSLRGVIAELPLSVLITGKVGVGKTQTNANLTLSFQDQMRDRMMQEMMTIRAEFPRYPFELLDQQVGVMYFCGDLKSKQATRKLFREIFSEGDDLYFGYTGRRTFSDGVVVKHLRERILDYAELQYMYRIQSIVFSSYSLRLDGDLTDKGKLPVWVHDYFRSPPFDPRGVVSRAHILDFDTLRLGKTVGDGGSAGAWEFGVLSHTEMGKDFGNQLTNKDLKASDRRANIKNDMLIDRLKIIRHSSTACYIPFAQYIGDEQRPSSLAADMLELCDVLKLIRSGEDRCAYRFFLFERFLYDRLMAIWQGWYLRRCVNRADEDLTTLLLRSLVDFFYGRYQEKINLFGYQMIEAKLVDGSDPAGEGKMVVLPSCFKKVRSDRYATDCFRDILAARAEASEWEMDAAPVYAGKVASTDEIGASHSYFGERLLRIRETGEET